MLSYQLRLEQNVLVTSESEAPRPIAPILACDDHVQSDGLGGLDTLNTVESF